MSVFPKKISWTARATVSATRSGFWQYCRDHGYTAIRHYDEDDGYSGTNFQPAAFSADACRHQGGKIKRVVVKDMSRFGRNYLQVGMYTEMLFPEYGVHFIAVNDGVDSVRGTASLPQSATYSMKCTPRTPARKSGQRGNPRDAPANTLPPSRPMGTRKTRRTRSGGSWTRSCRHCPKDFRTVHGRFGANADHKMAAKKQGAEPYCLRLR